MCIYLGGAINNTVRTYTLENTVIALYLSFQQNLVQSLTGHGSPLLTLGAHAQEGYGTCPVCLCVCVSLSVMTFSATSFVSTLESRYIRVDYRLFLIFNLWIFDKPLWREKANMV